MSAKKNIYHQVNDNFILYETIYLTYHLSFDINSTWILETCWTFMNFLSLKNYNVCYEFSCFIKRDRQFNKNVFYLRLCTIQLWHNSNLLLSSSQYEWKGWKIKELSLSPLWKVKSKKLFQSRQIYNVSHLYFFVLSILTPYLHHYVWYNNLSDEAYYCKSLEHVELC